MLSTLSDDFTVLAWTVHELINNSKSFAIPFESEIPIGFLNLINDSDSEDVSWQASFIEIGVNPLSLGDLKLTRQHGKYFEDGIQMFEDEGGEIPRGDRGALLSFQGRAELRLVA